MIPEKLPPLASQETQTFDSPGTDPALHIFQLNTKGLSAGMCSIIHRHHPQTAEMQSLHKY